MSSRPTSSPRSARCSPSSVRRLEEVARTASPPGRVGGRGNARELENVVERALALSDADTLGPEDVPLPGSATGQPRGGDDFLREAAARSLTLHDLDELYTEQVLQETRGNKVQAARILGIDRKTLYRRAEREARRAGKEG